MAGIDPRSRATTDQYGVVKLAPKGKSVAGAVILSDDPRIKALAAHAITHKKNGADAIKLDELEPPDNGTKLDATAALHGLMSKAAMAKLNGIPAGGATGVNFHLGAADPGAGTGNNNDIAYNTTTGGWLRKAAGVWTEFARGPINITDSQVTFKTPTAGDGTAELATP